jgi:hypothetical protein
MARAARTERKGALRLKTVSSTAIVTNILCQEGRSRDAETKPPREAAAMKSTARRKAQFLARLGRDAD